MVKKIFHSILLSIVLIGCTDKSPQWQTLTIELKRVTATRCTVVITPSNHKMAYAVGVTQADDILFGASDELIITQQLTLMNQLYDTYLEQTDLQLDFDDIFLYYGEQSIDITHLNPDMQSEVLAFAVDPLTHKPVGKLYRLPFVTDKLDSVNLVFEVVASGDTLKLIPSCDTVPYVFAYEQMSIIEEDYQTPDNFMSQIVQLRAEYDFPLIQGQTDIILSEDPYLQADSTYILCACGITPTWHEMNSRIFTIQFQYNQSNIRLFNKKQFKK